MFLGLPNPDPYFVRIRILPSTSKKSNKTLISTINLLIFDFLSMKTDVNVTSKRNKQKNFEKAYFLLASCLPLTKTAGSGAESESGSRSQWCVSVPIFHGSTTLNIALLLGISLLGRLGNMLIS
jgi:hypothetical protein